MARKEEDSDNWQAAYELYLPYLIEIKNRVVRLGMFFAVFAVIGFIFYERFIAFFLSLLSLDGVNVVFTSPFQFINLAISTGMMFGLVGVLPVAVYQLFSFLKPALSKTEYRVVRVLVPLVFLLFILGFLYGFMAMRYVLILFQQQAADLNIGNVLDVSGLLSQIIITSSLMGLAFEFPLILSALVRLKIITLRMLIQHRVPAHIVSLIFAALLPTSDLLSLLLLTTPLMLLYELTILVNRVTQRAQPQNHG